MVESESLDESEGYLLQTVSVEEVKMEWSGKNLECVASQVNIQCSGMKSTNCVKILSPTYLRTRTLLKVAVWEMVA